MIVDSTGNVYIGIDDHSGILQIMKYDNLLTLKVAFQITDNIATPLLGMIKSTFYDSTNSMIYYGGNVHVGTNVYLMFMQYAKSSDTLTFGEYGISS